MAMSTADLDADVISLPHAIRQRSIVLLESRAWLIGAPMTPWAAAWWGTFTNWCTATDDGAFNAYRERGPLIVFHYRVGACRWQLHAATGEFRNIDNKMASWRGFLGKYP